VKRLILVTGATVYIGGRLVRRLENRGLAVRCLARKPEFLAGKTRTGTEIVKGDVLAEETLADAMHGVYTAYYMVHSMGGVSKGDFEEEDRRAAENFARAARDAGVSRIVYLGGLGDEDSDLSPHLRSRHEVGRVLASTGVPVVEFRASIVIGSGSLSFEMLCSLVERLPAMITPRWVYVNAQPIAINDLLVYLEAALDMEPGEAGIYEIGGSDRVSYGDLMREYSRLRGLRRVMVPVPLLTPRLSSLWLGLVTPLYARVGRVLIESICHETVIRDDRARRKFKVEPMGVREALSSALKNEDREFAETRWSDAMSAGGTDPGLFGKYGGVRRGHRLIDSRQCTVDVCPDQAFAPVRRIGGRTGWYGYDWLWRLRGFHRLAPRRSRCASGKT